MDPKPVRIFQPATQAQKFDPEGEYIREWLPELRSIDTEFLLSGNIPEQERDALGYPAQLWITNNSSASLRCSINSKIKLGLRKHKN